MGRLQGQISAGGRWLLAGIGTGSLALTLVAGAAAEPAPLLSGVGRYSPAPYAIFDGDQLRSGLIFDLSVELGRRLDRPVRFVEVPRKRIGPDLGTGAIDLYCIMNPAWIDLPPGVQWSPPLFMDKLVFLERADGPVIDRLEDLSGRRVGTGLGYHYSPAVDAAFAKGISQRDDAQTLAANMERLARGWVDAVLESELAIAYLRRVTPDLPPLKIAGFIDSVNAIHCAYAGKPDLAPGLVNPAFTQMVTDGAVESILARYR